jgi:hypothetical protein
MLRARIDRQSGSVHCGKKNCRGMLGQIGTDTVRLRAGYRQGVDGIWDFTKRALARLARANYEGSRAKQIDLLNRPRQRGSGRVLSDGRTEPHYVLLESERMMNREPLVLPITVRCYICRWLNEFDDGLTLRYAKPKQNC